MDCQTLCAAVLIVVVTAMPGMSQTPTGTLQGMVQDGSGGAIPEVSITIRNQSTGETRQLLTDSSGRFVQPFLLPAFYSVTAEKPGFRSVRQENIKIDVSQNRSVDFTLEIGAVTQEVSVVAAAPPLDVNTSSIGQVIENKRIIDLPLNGRGVFNLANLTPGVNPTGGGATPAMGGARNAISELQIDGVTNIAPENNIGVNQRVYEPQVDAVEEFTVQVNALSAEYGRFGGGVINVVTKSGTNSLHGTGYDFLRNSVLDANNFFANRAGRERGAFQRNQWGGTVGGPIVLPRLYNGRNKSFFFAGMEATNQRSQSVFTGTMPPDEWRRGDFSNLRTASGAPITLYDPTTGRPDPANPARFIREPFPGNIIPLQRQDPVALNTMRYFPQPNVAPTNPYTFANNFTSAGKGANDSYRVDSRVDHNFTDAWRMFVRVSTSWYDNTSFNGFGNLATSSGSGWGNGRALNASMDHTVTVSPSLILNFRYGAGRTRATSIPFSNGIDLVALGYPAALQEAANREGREFPRLEFSGAVSPLGQSGWTRLNMVPMVHSLTGSGTKILTRHTVKFGGEFRKLLINFAQSGYPSSMYTFSSGWTQQEITTVSGTAGFPFASYLLGLPSGGQMTHDPAVASASEYYALYVQDDWKVTSRLTLNLGLRYDLDIPRTERYNRYSMFDLNAPSPIAGRVPASACPSCGNLRGAMNFVSAENRRQVPTDRNNFGPRIGFALQATKRTAIRGGYGIAYPPSALQAAGSTGAPGMEGFRTSSSVNASFDSGRTIHATLRNPFPDGFNFPPGTSQGAATNLGLGIGESLFDGWKNSYVQQWNLNVQRELPGNMVAEVGYLGNRGIGLIDGDGGQPYNQLTTDKLALGSELLRLVPNPFYGVITNPLSGLSREQVEYRQLLRPYPQYGGIGSFRKPIASSTYHGMTVRVDKRFSRGISFLLAYTLGKLIDDSSSAVSFLGPIAGTRLDAYNRRLERSVSSMDVAQRLVLSYVWELPFGKGRPLLNDLPRGLNMLVTGWQFNGITTFQSGTPLIVFAQANNTNIYTSSQRPNNAGRTSRITGGTTDERLGRWFDTSVFSQPAAFTLGNTSRTLPDSRNPGQRNWDLSFFKNTYFGPDSRLNLQYRLEMFNAFNTPLFSGPGTTVNSGAFGVISGTAIGPRVIQMALKFVF